MTEKKKGVSKLAKDFVTNGEWIYVRWEKLRDPTIKGG